MGGVVYVYAYREAEAWGCSRLTPGDVCPASKSHTAVFKQ